MKALQEVWR